MFGIDIVKNNLKNLAFILHNINKFTIKKIINFKLKIRRMRI